MIPKRYAHIAFGFLLSGMMSFLVAGISTFLAVGLGAGFVGAWIGAWLPSWAVAFPIVLVVAPLARRLVAALTAEDRPHPDQTYPCAASHALRKRGGAMARQVFRKRAEALPGSMRPAATRMSPCLA
mgnify:CR=1 FL=1